MCCFVLIVIFQAMHPAVRKKILISHNCYISHTKLILGNVLRIPSIITAEYVKQCSRSDPKLKTCLIDALHHLRPYLSVGIPEIELPSVEPFRVSSL